MTDDALVRVRNLDSDDAIIFNAPLIIVQQIIEEGFCVYPAEAFPRDSRAPLVAAGIGNLLDHDKLKQYYESGRVTSLLVVVMRESTLDHKKALFDDALNRRQRRNQLESTTDREIATQLQDNAQKVVKIYRLCIQWLTEMQGQPPEAREKQLDPEVANLIKQFKETADFLYEVMSEVSRRVMAGNRNIAQTLQTIGRPDDEQAHRDLRTGFEVVEVIYQYSNYTVQRSAEMFIAAFFMNCGLWEGDRAQDHGARSALLYSIIRTHVLQLPDVASLIAEHGKIKAMTRAYQAYVTTRVHGDDKQTSMTFEYRGHSGAENEIRLWLQETINLAWHPEDHEIDIVVEPADPEFVADLTILTIAEWIVASVEKGETHQATFAAMVEKITRSSIPNYRLDRHLHTRQSAYAKVLAAAARVHSVFPVGAFIQFSYEENGHRHAAEQLALNGGIALCVAEGVWWLLGHKEKPGELLIRPNNILDLTSARMGPRNFPKQRIIFLEDVIDGRIFRARGSVVGFLNRKTLLDFIEKEDETIRSAMYKFTSER